MFTKTNFRTFLISLQPDASDLWYFKPWVMFGQILKFWKKYQSFKLDIGIWKKEFVIIEQLLYEICMTKFTSIQLSKLHVIWRIVIKLKAHLFIKKIDKDWNHDLPNLTERREEEGGEVFR